MKSNAFLFGLVLVLGLQLLPARADEQPTAFEKALYDKARYRVLSRLDGTDFVSYCITMNVGGDTLLKFHDEILAKQTELAALVAKGLTEADPRIIAANAALTDLRAQFSVKIVEARKGLEVESRIAEETLTELAPYQK